MNKQKRTEIFERLRAENPHPTTELNYTSPFELLIAVMLSAQATDKGVNKATDRLYPIANTPTAIHALGVDRLKQYIKTIGLFNGKAANIIKTCAISKTATTVKYRKIEKALRHYRASGVKPPMSFSTPPLANQPSQSIPIFFASPTALKWLLAKRFWRSSGS